MVDDCRVAFERDTGLDWNQEGGEYAQDHFVGGWKAAKETMPVSSGPTDEEIERVALALTCWRGNLRLVPIKSMSLLSGYEQIAYREQARAAIRAMRGQS